MRRHLVSQIVKWVFSLLSFVLAAIGLGGIPDATTQWADWIQDLQRITTPDILRTALVAFGVAILLSVHGGPRLVQFAFSKLFRKENGQPFRVCYRVFNDLVLGSKAVLDVYNDGEPAQFRATARITKQPPPLIQEEPWFTLVWDDSSEDTVTIGSGDRRSITLADHVVLARKDPSTGTERVYGVRFKRLTTDGVENFERGNWLPDLAPRFPPVIEAEVFVHSDGLPAASLKETYRIAVVRVGEIEFKKIQPLGTATPQTVESI